MNPIKYPSLNGLRAISILLVIIDHLCKHYDIFKNFIYEIPTIPRLVLLFIQDGALGVNIFFVISGFLITSLLLQEEESTQTISVKNFYLRRTLRIFPAYYTLLLFYFVLQLFGYIQLSN